MMSRRYAIANFVLTTGSARSPRSRAVFASRSCLIVGRLNGPTTGSMIAAVVRFAGDCDHVAGKDQATDSDREAHHQDRERFAVTAQHAIPPSVLVQL